MPINYDDIVQYNLSDPPGGTPPTRKWQVNPAKVLPPVSFLDSFES